MKRRGLVVTVTAAALLAATLLAPGSALGFEPVASFGSYGDGAGQLSGPGSIAVGPDGNFFVADGSNNRVAAFSSTGDFLYAFGKGVRPGGGGVCDAGSRCRSGEAGSAAGELWAPEGIAVSDSGDVYVAEPINNRLSVFSATGSFQFAFGKDVNPAGVSGEERAVCSAVCQEGSNEGPPPGPGEKGPSGPAGAIGLPTGIAIGAAGRVFVAEAENHRISVFGPLGKFLFAFGLEVDSKTSESKCTEDCREGNPSAGGISEPGGIAAMPGGQLAISDTGNHRIDVYSEEGEFVRSIGREVDPAGGGICVVRAECRAGAPEGAGAVNRPAGLAVSPTGAITVADPGPLVEPPIPGPERVTRFNAGGEFLRSFGAGVLDGTAGFQICTELTGCRNGLDATVPGATPHPYGVAEACGGSIFVAESSDAFARIERFGEPGSAALCARPGEQQTPSVVRGRVVPSNFFRFGRVKRNRHHGTATLAVSVPVPGQLDLRGRGIRPAGRTLGAATTVALPVRLLGRFRRQLLAAGQRKAVPRITFTPDGGNPRTEQRPLTLVKRPKPQSKPKPRRQHR